MTRNWVVIPVGAYLCLHILFILEEDAAFNGFLAAWLAAVIAGTYARKAKRPAWEAAFAGAWFPVLMAFGRIYWKLGISSPASSAQRLVEFFGWRYAPSSIALAACLLPAGLIGYGGVVFNRWWEKKTGRPFFEVDE